MSLDARANSRKIEIKMRNSAMQWCLFKIKVLELKGVQLVETELYGSY